jgi:hypothetical protein
LLPPLDVVVASGTIHQGHGVYFKLKPSTQTTLEGMKLFSAICAVPSGWRGGCLKLRCEALALDRGVIPAFDRQVEGGSAVFGLALYLEGDGEAERLANHIATCQQELCAFLADDAHEVATSSHHVAPWRNRPLGSPWGWNKLFWLGGAATVPTRTELLTQVLDRTPAASLKEVFPKHVLTKVRDLQEAIEALRMISDRQCRTGKLADSTGTAPVGIAPRHTNKQPSQTQSRPRADGVASVANGQNNRDIVGAGGPPTKNSPSGGTPSTGQAQPLGRIAGTAQALGNTQKSAEEKPAPAPSAEPFTPDQPSRRLSRQVWYFIASICGAAFTYVLAPLILDVLRRFFKNRRLRRLKAVKTSSGAVEYTSSIVTVANPHNAN